MRLFTTVALLTLPLALSRARTDASDAFFSKGEIQRLKIELDQDSLDRLRADPRAYVHATLRENEKTVYEDVAVKLKGAAGSFREVDDKPAFTLNLDKFRKGQDFHGLEKLHLNNSVQDGTWLHEFVGSELFRAAGIPAPRVTHARVWLNGRELGLYVLKEAFDERFLARFFADARGNLYDGGFVQDVDAPLEKDSGKGPDDKSDLRALVEACRESDPAVRFARMAELLDVEKFITFVAMELSIGHWDGYSLNKNNYRLYFDPTSRKACFLPHGMDQIFGDPDASVLEYPVTLVSEAVMRNPEWRARFRQRLTELLPLFASKSLRTSVDQAADRLRPVLKAIEGGGAGNHAALVKDLESRLQDREKSLREQCRRAEPKSLEFDPRGVARLTGWAAASEVGYAGLQQVAHAGRRAYGVDSTDSPCVAGWRRKVTLARGRYSFEASVKTRDVAPLANESGSGARLRMDGGEASVSLAGTESWRPLAFTFEVKEESRLVELVAELRAARGSAWFDLASLRLVHLP